MSRIEKAKERLRAVPKDYTYSEAKYLLGQLGFQEDTKGRTSGSRVRFYRPSDGKTILFHRPHPTDTMSIGNIRDLADTLKELGEI